MTRPGDNKFRCGHLKLDDVSATRAISDAGKPSAVYRWNKGRPGSKSPGHLPAAATPGLQQGTSRVSPNTT